MRYRERLLITAPSTTAGSHDPVTHVFTPAAGPDTLYDGLADVQDGGAALDQNGQARSSIKSDAVAYVADESAIGVIQRAVATRPELAATVTWADGSTSTGVVETVVRLDGAIELRWVR